MASIFKRGKTWYVDYRQNGQRYQVSLKTRAKRLAELKCAEIEMNIERGQLGMGKRLESSQKAFNGFAMEVLSKKSPPWQKRTEQLMRPFRTWVESNPSMDVSKLSTSDIETFLRERLRDVAAKTLNEELSLIKRFYKWLLEREYIAKDPTVPIQRLKQMPKAVRIFTADELALIFRHATKVQLPFYQLLLYTGLRDGELRNLEWDDVDFANRLIYVRIKAEWVPKTRQGRAVPMAQQALDLLRSLPQTGRYVLSTRNGKPWVPPRQPWVTLLKRIHKKEGIDLSGQVSIHCFRHTFATACLMQGVEIKTVSEFLGHTSVKMTERYLHLLPEHKVQQMKKVDFTKLMSASPSIC